MAGCERCDCDRIGSTNYTCEQRGGQCQCKTGVTGRRCDTCQRYFFGFSPSGCQGEFMGIDNGDERRGDSGQNECMRIHTDRF